MLHKISSHQVVLVSDPGALLVLGGEQEPWRFQAAACQDEPPRDYPVTRPVRSHEFEAFYHRFAFGFIDINNGRVEKDPDVSRSL